MSIDWLLATLHLPFLVIPSAFFLELGTYMQVDSYPNPSIKRHIPTIRIIIHSYIRKRFTDVSHLFLKAIFQVSVVLNVLNRMAYTSIP